MRTLAILGIFASLASASFAQDGPVLSLKKGELPPVSLRPSWTVAQTGTTFIVTVAQLGYLKLDKATIATIAKAEDELVTREQSMSRNGEPDDAQIARAEADSADSILKLLKPAELDRLKELTVQALGVDAFRYNEVKTAVGVSSDQSAKISDLLKSLDDKQDDYDGKLGEGLSKVPPAADDTKASQDAHLAAQRAVLDGLKPEKEAIEKLRLDIAAKIQTILSADQSAKLKGLQGEPPSAR